MVTVYVFGDEGDVCAGTLYEGFIHQTIHKPLSRQSRSIVPMSVFALLYQIPQSKKVRRICLNKGPHLVCFRLTVVMMRPVRPRLGNGGFGNIRTIKSSRAEHTKSKLLAFLCGIDWAINYLFCFLPGSRVGNIRVFIKMSILDCRSSHADAFSEFSPPLLRLLI